MWSSGVRFIDRTSKDFHGIMTHTIVNVLAVTDKHYLEEIRPLATKTILERLRKRLENVVSRYRSLLKTELGKLIVIPTYLSNNPVCVHANPISVFLLQNPSSRKIRLPSWWSQVRSAFRKRFD